MKRIEKTILSIWEDIYFIFSQLESLTPTEKHTLFSVLDDLVIEISKFDVDVIKKNTINKSFKTFVDKYFYLIAEITSNELFIFTFSAFSFAINNLIRECEIKERFETASNFFEIRNVLIEQREKWIPISNI